MPINAKPGLRADWGELARDAALRLAVALLGYLAVVGLGWALVEWVS